MPVRQKPIHMSGELAGLIFIGRLMKAYVLKMRIMPLCLFFLHSVSWRKNSYDGCLEYYVVVKERGQREEQTSQEEIQRKLSQVAQLQAIR